MTLPILESHLALPSIRLRVASSLGWLAGSYSLVVSASMIYLALAAGHAIPLLFAINAVFGVLCCVAGYLVWRRNKAGAILAVFLSLSTGLALALKAWFLTLTFVLTVLGLVLILLSWREFHWRAAA